MTANKYHPCMHGGRCKCGAECGSVIGKAQRAAESVVGPIEFSDAGLVKAALLLGGLGALAYFGIRYALRRK